MRRLVAGSSAQGLIFRWVRAHRFLNDFRSNEGKISPQISDPVHKFWYGTRPRVLVSLVLMEASLADERLSKREIARRSHVSLPTVIGILKDGVAQNLIDEKYNLSKESVDLISEKILEVTGSQEFRLLAEAVRTYHLSREVPVDPFSEAEE
jgi:hypothetical protein